MNPSPICLDKRRAPRFRCVLPVELESGRGITRDLSRSGIYFETEGKLSPGQPIEFSIVMEYFHPERFARLKYRGVIVRVERRGEKLGVATAIRSYSLEELNYDGREASSTSSDKRAVCQGRGEKGRQAGLY